MPVQSYPQPMLGVVVLVLGLLVESQLALQTTCYPASATLVALQSTDFLLEVQRFSPAVLVCFRYSCGLLSWSPVFCLIMLAYQLANGIQPHKIKGVSVRLFARKPDGTTYDQNYIDMSIASLEEIDGASATLLGYSFRNDTAAVCEVTETAALVKTRGISFGLLPCTKYKHTNCLHYRGPLLACEAGCCFDKFAHPTLTKRRQSLHYVEAYLQFLQWLGNNSILRLLSRSRVRSYSPCFLMPCRLICFFFQIYAVPSSLR
jgi:hypothetical protein